MIRSSINRLFLLLSACLLLAACGSLPSNVKHTGKQPHIFPDYIGVTIPVGIAPLNFTMADKDYDKIDVVVRGTAGDSLHVNGSYADFPLEAWHRLLASNRGQRLIVKVCARKGGQWYAFRDFHIQVSRHPLQEWGITYRLIPPCYDMYSKMGLYERNLSNFSETALIENTQIPGQCVNCHTSNRTNPDQFVFHVRGSHGATVIRNPLPADLQPRVELLKARSDSLGGSMVYPYWHPGGRYCAFSTNKTTQMFHTNMPGKRVEVYDSSSDVFVYDTHTHTVLTDTLTMRSTWAENTPAFSPDGKWLYFITAPQQDYPSGYNSQRYSLCRVAFNASTGLLGNHVDTLVSASATGKSVSWPRPSYDGCYLMYTQTDYGYFSIWHPEADLCLLDLQTLNAFPMTEVNTLRSESFHNWSANSHWFLFTSRRGDGLYTRVYFSSIDDSGRATKPFLLPQRNPRQYDERLLYSFNTPDFVSHPVPFDSRKTARLIEDTLRTGFLIRAE